MGWKPHRLDVRVTPDRSTYAIREQANISIDVKRADGAPLPAGAEIALAAVDEALLELAPNPSWALLDEMMGQRGTRGADLHRATAGGRKASLRSQGCASWRRRRSGKRTRVLRYAAGMARPGEARCERQGAGRHSLNDSLTNFRIVAVASAGAASFGTGTATIATRQDLVLLSGLPPVVREGDEYSATFTVRNTSNATMPVELTAEVTPKLAVAPIKVDVPAGEARDVSWRVKAPVGTSKLTWDVSAKHVQQRRHPIDSKVSEKVVPAYPVRTYQATIQQLGPPPLAPANIPAEMPKGAVPGRGGMEVTLRAKLGDGLDGVREFMSLYPYVCLEQNLSRAVALRDQGLWDSWMNDLPSYMDRDGLLRYFPNEIYDGEDALTAYVLAIAHEAGYYDPRIPAKSHDRGPQGLRRRHGDPQLGATDGGPRHSQDRGHRSAVALWRGSAEHARQHHDRARTCGRLPRSSTGSASCATWRTFRSRMRSAATPKP